MERETELASMHKNGLLSDEEYRIAISSLRSENKFASPKFSVDFFKRKEVLLPIAAAIIAISIGVWFFAFRTVENFLTVGKPAKITTKAGIYIRSVPNNLNGRSIGLIPYKQMFEVLEEGAMQKIYRINSRWYLVRYKSIVGWAWGGFAEHED